MPRPHPKEFRDDVLAVTRRGEAPIKDIAKDFGISESCLRNWLHAGDDLSTRHVTETRISSAASSRTSRCTGSLAGAPATATPRHGAAPRSPAAENRILRRASPSSADSEAVAAGLLPSSTSAACSQLRRPRTGDPEVLHRSLTATGECHDVAKLVG